MGAHRQSGIAPVGSRALKKWIAAAVILAIAAALLVIVSLPPHRLVLAVPFPDRTVAGIVHVHSNRSDGSSDPATIAAAAARAGLKFLVFTDHGDATRAPDPPVYRSGVLCLDAVEISTSGGHYIALDMPAAPFPLGGEPRAVVEDVHRLGGFGIVAHPDSPKPALQWTDWAAPFDAVEAVNLDTNWRAWVDQARRSDTPWRSRWGADRRLLESLLAYPFRSAETIAALTKPDAGRAARAQAAAQPRRVVMIGGADAHAQIAVRGDRWDNTSAWALPIPGYEATFRASSVHAAVESPFNGDARRDAQVLMRAIRSGHVYVAIDGLASPPSFDFSATNALGSVHEGDELGAGGPIALHVRSNAPPSFTTWLWRGGELVSGDHHESEFTVVVPDEPAEYAVEIRATDRARPVPWVLSNPVYVGGAPVPTTRTPERVVTDTRPLFDGASTAGWHVEHDPSSDGAIDIGPLLGGGAALRIRYALSGGAAVGQFVAIVYDTPAGLDADDDVVLTVRADHPMRMSVQLREPDGAGGHDRWQRSIYVPTAAETRTISLRDFVRVGVTHRDAPVSSEIRSIMLVVDTTNTKPGMSGRLWMTRAALGR